MCSQVCDTLTNDLEIIRIIFTNIRINMLMTNARLEIGNTVVSGRNICQTSRMLRSPSGKQAKWGSDFEDRNLQNIGWHNGHLANHLLYKSRLVIWRMVLTKDYIRLDAYLSNLFDHHQ